MKLHQIADTVKTMTAGKDKVLAIQKRLEQRIGEIHAEGKSDAWTKANIEQVREEAGKEALSLATGINEDATSIAEHEQFYTPAFVLSQLPLTPSKATDPFTADNVHAEAVSRQALISEATLMSNQQLSSAIKHALATQQPARFYLLSMVMNSRDSKSAGWEPVNLDTVKCPESEQAQKLFRTARAINAESIITLRELKGVNRMNTLTDRLTIGHELKGGK